MLWHQILGHIGEKGLWALKNKNIFYKFHSYALEFDFYGWCIYAKYNRVKFISHSLKFSRSLDLIHSNVSH